MWQRSIARAHALAWVSVGVVGAAMLAGCGSTSSAQSKVSGTLGEGKDLSSVCKAGASEGEVNFRDTTDPETFKKEVAGFNATYPDIKVNFGSQQPQDSIAAIVTQVQAHHELDVDAVAIDMPSAEPLIQQKLVQPVAWTRLGVDGSDLLDYQGSTFVRTQRTILGLGYNTTKLKASEVPDTWAELVNPKWAGKVIVDPRGKYLSGLGIAWGEDKAISWYKDLLATDKPQIVNGATDSVQKVASGEALLTTSSHDAEILEQSSEGAPLAIKYLDVVPTQDHYAVILNGAAHPSAAACFLGWWSGPEGQAAQLKYEYKGNETHPKGVPATSTLSTIATAEQATVQSKVADQFASMTAP